MTKKFHKGPDGMYDIRGKKYKLIRGSRAQVWHDTAYKTDGTPGLTKDDLHMNEKTRQIVSKNKHNSAKKENRLERYGYFTRKGKFGSTKRKTKKHHNKHDKKHHKKYDKKHHRKTNKNHHNKHDKNHHKKQRKTRKH